MALEAVGPEKGVHRVAEAALEQPGRRVGCGRGSGRAIGRGRPERDECQEEADYRDRRAHRVPGFPQSVGRGFVFQFLN